MESLSEINNNEKEDIIREFFQKYEGYFNEEDIPFLEDNLRYCTISELSRLDSIMLKDPIKMELFSVFLGLFGTDRFLMGEVGKGFLKLFTAGGFGIIAVKDMITTIPKVRQYNFDHLTYYMNIEKD